MEWNDLRFVLAIAQKRTLLGAGAALGVAHTTVGRRLRGMEKELGVLLFERTPNGLVATDAGEDLAVVAEQVESEVLAAEGRVLGRDGLLRGKLRVSTVDALFFRFENAFTGFMERYPSIELSLDISAEPLSLPRREADVVMRLSNEPPDTLVGRKLGPVQFGVYAGRSLVDRVGEGAPLDAYPWIGWNGGKNESWFQGWLSENAPNAQIVLRIDNRALVMAQAIRSGIGVQILPCFLADPDPELRRIAPLEDLFRLDLWILTLPELRTNRRVRAFMEHMSAALAENRGLLAGTDG